MDDIFIYIYIYIKKNYRDDWQQSISLGFSSITAMT